MTSSPLHLDRIPVLAGTDILVVGAGSAGCVAALAARGRGNPDVILLERYGFPGGTSTQMLDTFYGFFTPGADSRKVVGGIPDCVVDALDAANAVFLRPNTYGAGTGVNYNPERLKLVWDRLLEKSGVRTLLHATLVAAETDPADRLTGVVISTRQGFFRIRAKRFIDASGDADLCHHANIPYEKAGDIDPAQSMTTTFRMSHVDLTAYEAAGGKKMLMRKMSAAVDRGSHPLPRKAGSIHPMNAAGCISTVAVKVAGLDPTDFQQLGQAEREGRRQAFIYEAFLQDCVPGFARSNIIGLSHHIGVRETRRVHGEARLTRDHCMDVARFDDRVLLCGAPIEDHRPAKGGGEETAWAYVPDGQAYDVPYRTLVPKGREEIWVAGRCFSATHDAHASCRSMAQTMAMGQAAGTAAALSLETNTTALTLDVPTLQHCLRQHGALLETPKTKAHTGPQDWKQNRT